MGVENSPGAMRVAQDRGATDIEVLVSMTVDGELIAGYDTMVTDHDPARRWRSQVTLAELRQALGRDEQPVLLADVLDGVVEVGLGLYLSVKQLLPGGCEKLGELVRAKGLAHRTLAGSDRSDLVAGLKAEGGLANCFVYMDPFFDIYSLARGLDLDFLHPRFTFGPDNISLLEPSWVETVKYLGLGLVGWNINDFDDALDFYARGADALCTDNPDLLVKALAHLT